MMVDSLAVTPTHGAVDDLLYMVIVGIVIAASAVLAYRAVLSLAAAGVDESGKPQTWWLLKTVPSTNLRIVVELSLAVLFVLGCMIADMIAHPVSDTTQETLGLFIAAMLGVGAGQFFGKRKTDEKYLAGKAAIEAAKSTAPATTVNASGKTEVTGGPVTVEPRTTEPG